MDNASRALTGELVVQLHSGLDVTRSGTSTLASPWSARKSNEGASSNSRLGFVTLRPSCTVAPRDCLHPTSGRVITHDAHGGYWLPAADATASPRATPQQSHKGYRGRLSLASFCIRSFRMVVLAMEALLACIAGPSSGRGTHCRGVGM